MARHFDDWLSAFVDYASYSEAPKRMHFWSGVSAIAGALRRKVWIDQRFFKWYPNFYIIFVAPPGIVSKSTTASIAMSILREVPGIYFGPDVTTWQSLVSSLGSVTEAVEINGVYYTQSAITLESSEFGNLFDPNNRDMVDMFVNLWDGKQGTMSKTTKSSGNDSVENPWINLIACTTPAWIAGNFPEYIIGGGFTSRCIFVYADKKEKLVPYLSEVMGHEFQSETRSKLREDLIEISKLGGEYRLTPAAIRWGEEWYRSHYNGIRTVDMQDERFDGYIARKQSHIHKTAMVIAASQSDAMFIEAEHLQLAAAMVNDLEQDMSKVFNKIGKSDTSRIVDRLMQYIETKQCLTYSEVYRYVHAHFPALRNFEDMLAGLVKAGFITLKVKDGVQYVFHRKETRAESEQVVELPDSDGSVVC